MNKKILTYSLLAGLISLLLFFSSCATSPSMAGTSSFPSKGTAAAAKVSGSPVYYGAGEGSSMTRALNSAKLTAVKKAVVDALGKASSLVNKEKLQNNIYEKIDVNALVYNDTVRIIDKSTGGDIYTVTLGVRINLPAVAAVLRKEKIYGGLILPQGGDVVLSDQEPPVVSSSGKSESTGVSTEPAVNAQTKEGPAAGQSNVNTEEALLIDNIIDNLTYMVYYDEKTISNPFIAKTAVGMANKYLAENGLEYVDLDQIEQIKKDQAAAYEEETGQSVSMIQWIAGKLNADIYIEVSVNTHSSVKDGKYYGSASVSLKNFDASTGAGRGTAFYQTIPPSMSTVSTADAVNNAVASATYNAIRDAVGQAVVYTKKELVQGIKYSLVMQNTSDSKLMRTFMKKLKRKVKSVRRISASPEETKYEVRLIGRIEDLEDIVYETADDITGLEGVSLVYQRGNSITFDTGL